MNPDRDHRQTNVRKILDTTQTHYLAREPIMLGFMLGALRITMAREQVFLDDEVVYRVVGQSFENFTDGIPIWIRLGQLVVQLVRGVDQPTVLFVDRLNSKYKFIGPWKEGHGNLLMYSLEQGAHGARRDGKVSVLPQFHMSTMGISGSKRKIFKELIEPDRRIGGVAGMTAPQGLLNRENY